jgi:predicted kinase
MKKLLLLNGHPGSGKSTVAREAALRVPRVAVLDVDFFRKFVSDYNLSRKDVSMMWRATYALVEVYLSAGISVLVDRCVPEQEVIRKLQKQARKQGAVFQEIVLYTATLACAVHRVEHRPRKQLSKNKKSLINRQLIKNLRAAMLKETLKPRVVSFDTERLSLSDVVESVVGIIGRKA